MDLHGKSVLITREKIQAELFAEKIAKANGIPIIVDLLKIKCHCTKTVDLINYDWIFFTSANGVHCFFEKFQGELGNSKIAVVGPKTNQMLKQYGYSADFIPSIYNAKTMAAEFLMEYGIAKTVLLVRGNLASPILVDAFQQARVEFTCLEVYQTVINSSKQEILNKILTERQIDFLTFTSPSSVDAFLNMVENFQSAHQLVTVCIGTTTEKRALQQGFRNILVPKEFTIEGMLQEINDDVSKRG